MERKRYSFHVGIFSFHIIYIGSMSIDKQKNIWYN